ncbi:MAG: peptidoglycan DD-metalloendopeptidase family protein [Oceanicoccus sp.]
MKHATKNRPKRRLSQLVAEFPRKHLAIASTAVTAIFVAMLLVPGESAQAKRISLPVELKLEAKQLAMAKTAVPSPMMAWVEQDVQKGDNLSLIFQRASLSASDVHDIVNNSDNSKNLLKLYPGQKLAFQIDTDGKLQQLKHIQNKLKTTLFERDGGSFTTTQIEREPEIRQNYGSAFISSNLFNAAQRSGLSQNLIMELASVFGGVIDFVYDVRAGDNFTILYEEHFLDDEKTGNGPILAAQFTNRGETYSAYRYVYPDGSIGYYNENGVSMRKAFLRAPLDFTRISSGFNPKRLHPVFKTTRPHRGIDYAASRGTPVYAAGDGRIAKSGYSKANGNYVFINHGSNYTTKYLHLNKRGVKQGQKVKQRQIIGWVGSTGYATGPHLHYEFLVNGVHRNPRTILKKLPKAESIDEQEKQRFIAQISGVQLQLAAYNTHRSLATADQLPSNSTL